MSNNRFALKCAHYPYKYIGNYTCIQSVTISVEKTFSGNTFHDFECFIFREVIMNILKYVIKNPLIAFAYRKTSAYPENGFLTDADMEAKMKFKIRFIKAGWTLFDISLGVLAVYVFFIK